MFLNFTLWGMIQGEKEGKGRAGSVWSELTMVPSVVYACVCVCTCICVSLYKFLEHDNNQQVSLCTGE